MSNYHFLFFRHAPSKHNLVKEQWKAKYGGKSFKNAQQFKIVKYSPQLIDSNFIVESYCSSASSNFINFNQIELIICSPLKRCLQTCKHLIRGNEHRVKVIVQPMLSCRMGSSWDIGSSPTVLAQQYPNYDFSRLENMGQYWMFKLFQISRQIKWKEVQESGKDWNLYLLKLIQNQGGENFIQFFKRTRPLKQQFLSILNLHKFIDQNKKKILVVAHACAFSFMLGSQLSDNGKGKIKNKISFTHGEPKQFTSLDVLPKNYNNACQKIN